MLKFIFEIIFKILIKNFIKHRKFEQKFHSQNQQSTIGSWGGGRKFSETIILKNLFKNNRIIIISPCWNIQQNLVGTTTH